MRPDHMSLSTSIDQRLWTSVQNAYEAGNYTAAILDSVHYLSELIRNKSGLDSDGHALVSAAFGGQNPIIKVNALHTESEKDEQRGVDFLLRGIYTAIRNPRSHEKHTDSPEVADVVITFINYLAGLIDKSRSPFDKEQIVERVFDKHFAQNDKYADLLVERIPQRKRLDVLLEIFSRRTEGNSKSIVFFTKAVLRKLSAEEQVTFWEIVSEALENATGDAEFRTAIQIAENEWPKVSDIARLRVEHRLIESVREGEYDAEKKSCPKGSLGTWAPSIAKDFILQEEYVDAVVSRLRDDNPAARAYVLQYHFRTLRELRPKPPFWAVYTVRQRLREHDVAVHAALGFVELGSAFDSGEDEWVTALKEAYAEYEPPSIEITDDDIPF
jgi:uncharacterized protein (TIGR02391 family)